MSHVPPGTAVAPEIPGYTYVRPIGHGGFSDVYLYEQEMPRREVAIKVLRTEDLSDATREQFAAEANLMARVSNHPNIAAIYAADVDDDGQPYLVMEYCSGGSLGAFYRHYPMSVKDVLSLGVRLSGALEAAHRAGIVHRDVKPANILLTEYGVPVLSDFGISTIAEDFPESTRHPSLQGTATGSGDTSVGMSLPWAAPETLWDDPVSDARSDRYSLAATLYSLLAGHSPHEVPGGPNTASHLTGRIRSGFVAAMRRPDVPASLHEVLRRGLAHDRSARYESAAEMGQALQAVQRELGLEVTPLVVPRGAAPARPPAPTVRVHQAEPIQLPAGHATLMPPEDGQGATAVPAGESGAAGTPAPPPGDDGAAAPARQPWDPPSSAAPAGAQPAPFADPLPAQPPAAAPAQPGPRHGPGWRLVYGGFMGVLVVACIVVGVLLAVRAGSEPSFTGPAVENLQAAPNSAGVYQVTVPDGLPIPDDVESRVLETGTGTPLPEALQVDVSTDTASWQEGETFSLNPMESVNLGTTVTLTPEELASAIGQDVADMHGDDVLLVAAPVGYFANQHPALGITDSDASVVVVKIVSVL